MDWPEPPWTGFEARGFAPALNNDGLVETRYVRIAHNSSSLHHRIESLDYSTAIQMQSDYSMKPPSNRTNTSQRIRLYGQSHDGWLDRPLSSNGEFEFTGSDRLAKKRQLRSAPSYENARLHETCV